MVETFLSKTVEYYRGKLAQHGNSPEGMDWKDRASQYLRFEVIARYIDFTRHPSVLDVGCGSGEFFQFCIDRGKDIDYQGMDVCPEMVDACRQRFGSHIAVEGQALDLRSMPKTYDYVIASGTFNAKLETSEDDWRVYFHDSLRSMYDRCRVALIVNMMTCFVDYRYDRLYYARPDEVAHLAVSQMSRDFVLDHSYPLFEMTLAVFGKKE